MAPSQLPQAQEALTLPLLAHQPRAAHGLQGRPGCCLVLGPCLGCSPVPGQTGPPLPPGLLWQLRPSDVEVELLAHTRRVVSRDLEEETGLHTGWIQNGGLFIASNRQRLDEYKRLMSVGAPLPRWEAGQHGQGRSPDRSGVKSRCSPCWLGRLGGVTWPL